MKGFLSALPFFSNKQSKSDNSSELGAEVIQESVSECGNVVKEDGISGVSKYVNSMPVVTGVNRYIGRQESKISVYEGPSKVEVYIDGLPKKTGVMRYLDANEGNVLSSVEKYLKKQASSEVSGVAKYMANQLVARGKTPKKSGVEAYLSQQVEVVKENPVVHNPSSVEDYMAKNSRASLESTVGKYIAKRHTATSVRFDVTGVDKYQLEQEMLAKKKNAEVIVTRYLEEQAILAQENAAMIAAAEIAAEEAEILAQAEMENDNLSAVDLYLRKQAVLAKDKPVVTGVSKYLLVKMLEDNKKPTLSRVEQYVAGQKSAAKKVVKEVSSVDLYLKNKEATDKEAAVLSGVEKYVVIKSITDSHKPEVSGVARYMARVRYVMDAAVAVVGKSLEGEFIPAGQEIGASSVERYLDNKDSVEQASKPSGVAQYLDSRPEIVKVLDVSTSVDLYLEEQAIIARESRVSGVEKYLENHAVVEETVSGDVPVEALVETCEDFGPVVLTGVNQYLNTQPESVIIEEDVAPPAVELTGVDKYMVTKSEVDKELVLEKATGVEKYLMSTAG